MDRDSLFYRQVALLVRVLPWVATEKCFALKGGTAINLFVRDMPRLSVDIDLAYLPIEPREASLQHISAALLRLAALLRRRVPGCEVMPVPMKNSDAVCRLLIRQAGVAVKVEVTPVLRGAVYPPELRGVQPAVEDEFGYAEMQLVSWADLYGGKICAALDRQHPRDLFDIKLLLENEGISRDVFHAFLVYLISHHRPISELLAPHEKDITEVYEQHFAGMTREPVTVEALIAARRALTDELKRQFTDSDKEFLLSIKRGDPDWDSFPLPHARKLPAVQWKLRNIKNMQAARHEESMARLADVLARF